MTVLFPKQFMYGIVQVYRDPEYDHIKSFYNYVKREFGQEIANKFFANYRTNLRGRGHFCMNN